MRIMHRMLRKVITVSYSRRSCFRIVSVKLNTANTTAELLPGSSNPGGATSKYITKIVTLSKGFNSTGISVAGINTLGAATMTATNTGIITSIQISDRLDYFDIDSQLVMNGEIVKVIGKDYKNNLLNILRPTNGISHLQSESITLLPNKFQFTSTKQTPNYNIKNDSYYFYSAQSVSIGQTASVGLGNTLSIYPLGTLVTFKKKMDFENFLSQKMHFPGLSVYGITPENALGRKAQGRKIVENSPKAPGAG